LLDNSLAETLAWCDHVVLAQKLHSDLASQVTRAGLPVTDLVGPSLAYVAAPTASQVL